jgi:energy-coupling factor transport system permease protein
MSPFVYEPGSSILHRADAVSKFVWLLLVTIAAVLVSSPLQAIIVYFSVIATGILIGRLSLWTLFRRTIHVALVSAWLFIFLTLFSQQAEDSYFIHIGFVKIGPSNLSYSATLALRIFTLGTASAIFVLTTDPRRMVAEFVKYGHLPYRAGFAIYAALRFLPLLQHEARIIYHAHAIRADTSGSRGLISRFELARRLAIPLLAGALRRVQIMAVAMDARGFGAHATRTELDELHRHPAGWMIAGSQLLLLLSLVTWKIVDSTGPFLIRPPVGGH